MADANDPWAQVAQQGADDEWLKQTQEMKQAAASAPPGSSTSGDYSIEKAAPGSSTAVTELPDAPQHRYISGGAGGVTSGAGPDPWEQAAVEQRTSQAGAAGQNLVPLFQQQKRLGIPDYHSPQPPVPEASPQGGGPQTPWQAMQGRLGGGPLSHVLDEDVYVQSRWQQLYGQAAQQSAGPQLRAWAAQQGLDPSDPATAAEFVKKSVPDDLRLQAEGRFRMEKRYLDAVQARDDAAQALAQQFKLRNPQASDADTYRFVHQQLLAAGAPEDKTLPPFTIKGGQASSDVGVVRGTMDAFLKGTGDLAYKPAAFLEGLGQAVGDRFGGDRMGAPAQPGFFAGLRNATEAADQAWHQQLPSSDTASGDTSWRGTGARVAEGLAGAVPQIVAAAATGGASKVFTSAHLFLQNGGASFQEIYDSAKQRGMSDRDASAAAGVGAIVSGAVQTWLMKYGALGEMQKASARGYLTSVLKSAFAQGGVGGLQDAVQQVTNYAATGQDPDLERTLGAIATGAVTGGFFAAVSPAGFRAAWRDFKGAADPAAREQAAENARKAWGGGGGMTDAEARQHLGLDPTAPLTADQVKSAWRKTVLDRVNPERGATAQDLERVTAARAVLEGRLGQPGQPIAQPAPTPAEGPAQTAAPGEAAEQPNQSAAPPEQQAPPPPPPPSPPPAPVELEKPAPPPSPPGGNVSVSRTPIQDRSALLAQHEELTHLRGRLRAGDVPDDQRPGVEKHVDHLAATVQDGLEQFGRHHGEDAMEDLIEHMGRDPNVLLGSAGIETPKTGIKQAEPGITEHPPELADAHQVAQWYAHTFNDGPGAGAIEALASMGKGKYVLADVPPHVAETAVLQAGDKDPAKVDAIKALSPEARAALPPAIMVPMGRSGLAVADGSHRTLAAQQGGWKTLRAYVPQEWIGRQGITPAGQSSVANAGAAGETAPHEDQEPGQRRHSDEEPQHGRHQGEGIDRDRPRAGPADEGRGRGGGESLQRRKPDEGPDRTHAVEGHDERPGGQRVGRKSLFAGGDEDVERQERTEGLARLIQRDSPGTPDEHAHTLALEAVEAARTQHAKDPDLVDTAIVHVVYNNGFYNAPEVSWEFIKAVKAAAGIPTPGAGETNPGESNSTRVDTGTMGRDLHPWEHDLLSALSSTEGWEKRWSEIRRTGADNQQLREFIARQFGHQGGASSEHSKGYAYKGGNIPAFWSDTAVAQSKPTLTGKRLLEEVRRLLGIGQPGEKRELPYVEPTDAVLPGAGSEAAAGGAARRGSEGDVEAGVSAPSPAPPADGATGQRGEGGGGELQGPLQPAGGAGAGSRSGGRAGERRVPEPGAGGEGQPGGERDGQAAPDQRLPQDDEPAKRQAERKRAKAPAANASDYRITDPDALEAGGARTKFKQNVAAVELLRKIQGEGRDRATPAEQDVLAKFSGWGQFPQVFNDYGEHLGENARQWEDERRILKELLGDGWEAGKRSTLNAHYTSPRMVQAVYQVLERLGFKGGRFLEPSMGAGVFFGLMPEEMKGASRLTGVELDPTTGAIARLLYPSANVQVKGFQDVKIPDGFFDAAAGNVPFGDFRVNDKPYNQFAAPIHDYFFLKSLDKLRPGGVLAFITSTGTLDKGLANIRNELSKRADLVAAARLPEGAFQKSAGTQVVTDLLVFRKRGEGEKPGGEKFQTIGFQPDPDGGEPIPVNQYFVDHPEHVLGRLDRKSRLYRKGDVHVSATPDFEQRLQKWIEGLPAGVYREAPKSPTFEKPAELDAGAVKDGGFKVEKGKVYRNKGGALTPVELDKKTAEIVADTLKVRDALRALIDGQLQNEPQKKLDTLRTRLGEEYERFTKKHGALHKRQNLRAFSDDPDAPVVQALESDYDAKTGKVTRADVFTKNTVRGYEKPKTADSVGTALGISLNETGRVDVPRIAQLTGQDEAAAGQALVEKGLAFKDPGGGWKSAEQYLSGNVKKKLLEATDAAAADPQFAPNVKALQKVIPADVDYDQIGVRLGSSWVPAEDVKSFVAETFGGIPAHFSIRYLEKNGTWLADYTPTGKSRWKNSPQDRELYGTDRAGFMDVLEAALNNKRLNITDPHPTEKDRRVPNVAATEAANGKIKELEDLFRNWIWEDDDRRQRLHRQYNDTFNNIAPVKYDGSHLTFPGMNPAIALRAHQRNAIWQTIATGTGLYAHEVGTGKTFTMVGAAMELRRLGLAKKPAIAVPKKNQATIIRQAKQLYPAIRLHVVEDFDAKGRQKAVSKISTGDYDLIILTHDHLNMLPMSPEVQADFIQKEIAELEQVKMAVEGEDDGGPTYGRRAAKKDNRLVKQLEKMKAALETRLAEALDSKKDNAVTFEQTGIDQLFVDEAHAYKSLPVYTKQQRVKGIPTTRSDRATAMWMRGQWLQQMNNGRGLVFATGTPVTNTMAEVFTMQRYLQYKELEARGVSAFDAWASTFGALNTRTEYSVAGEYQPVTRFNEFINLPELQQISRQTIDVQRADQMPNFKRPRRVDHVVAVPPTPEQVAYLQTIKERAIAAKRTPPGTPGADNMLSISTDARKSAVDHRLVDPRADMTGGKVDRIAANVLKILKENPGTTQMVFSDFGLHPSDKNPFTFFGALQEALVKGGIPADRIVNFTTITDAQQRTAADELKEGLKIIGLASTTAGGTGINPQDHLIALHHADVPWFPASVEQRDGRGWRQGNQNKEVHIYRYVTEGGFDTFMWQTVDAKTRFIHQFMRGDAVQRAMTEEDGEELTPAQIMAVASGDPLLLDRINLEAEVSELDKAQQRHTRQELKLKDTAADLKKRLAAVGPQQKALRAAVDEAQKMAGGEFAMTIGGKQYTDRDEADAALLAAANKLALSPGGGTYAKVGEFKGFPIEAYRSYSGIAAFLTVAGERVQTGPSSGSIEYYARPAYWEGRLGELLNHQRQYQADLEKVQKAQGRPFSGGEVLKQKKMALADIQGKLAAKANPNQPPPAAGIIPAPGEGGTYAQRSSGGAGTVEAPTSKGGFYADPVIYDKNGTATGVAAQGGPAGGRKLLRPIAMPELLKLAKELGVTPLIKKLPRSAGLFSAKGKFGMIRIDPRRVVGHFALAKVLAHEVGHLEDWLPPGRFPARGNLIGSIQKLTGYLKHTFPTMGATNRAIRTELIALSEWWTPYDKANAKPSYVAYRNSPRELYAEALSALLNAPGEVEKRAPAFYAELLKALDRHEPFRDAYLSLQDLLAGTPEEIAASRRTDVREAYHKAEDVLKARALERIAAAAGRPLTAVRQLILNQIAPGLDLQRKVEKALSGALPAQANLRHLFAELTYADNETHIWLKELGEKVHDPLDAAGLSPEDLGEYLQMVRTESERKDLANPQGHNEHTAREMQQDLAKTLGPARYRELERIAQAFHDHVHEVVKGAVDAGYYGKDTYENVLLPNKDRYATFAVIEHLQDTIGAGIANQVGTFKDIANPYTATTLKTVSLIRAIQLQKAKAPLILLVKEDARQSGEKLEKAKPKIVDGGRRLPPGPAPAGKEWLTYYEDGRPEHYAVDPYLARMYKSHDVGMLNQLGKFLTRATYGTLHPLYVTFNLGWHLRLLPKDFQRVYRNSAFKGNPTTVREILAAYAKALPHAYRYAFGKDDDLVGRMLKDKALAVPGITWDFQETHDAHERLLDRYGLGEKPAKANPVIAAAAKVLHAVEAAGSMLVATPKIAGWKMLTDRGFDGMERSWRVRNHMGHPDRKQRGLGTNLTNGLAMYSNILLQFLQADAQAAVDPKTRAGWWVRTALTSGLPKALMAAAAAGLLGAWLKQFFDLVPEADKTKYHIVPLFIHAAKDGTRKAVYLKVPQDVMGTLLGGVQWKLSHKDGKPLTSQIAQAVDVPYADGPHLNPYIQSAANWSDFLRGQNPWDTWRQRNIIPDQDWKAGGWYAGKDMLQWQLNQLGILSTIGHAFIGKPGEKETTTESVYGSIPGGFVQESNRGILEKEELEAALDDREKARFKLSLGEQTRAAVRERYRLELVRKHDEDPKDRIRLARLGQWYGQVYLPLTKAIEAADRRGDQAEGKRLRATLEESAGALH